MTKFNTIEEMAEAYAKRYNEGYGDQTEKHMSTQDILDICVSHLSPMGAKAKYGIETKKTKEIENFGYVAV